MNEVMYLQHYMRHLAGAINQGKEGIAQEDRGRARGLTPACLSRAVVLPPQIAHDLYARSC